MRSAAPPRAGLAEAFAADGSDRCFDRPVDRSPDGVYDRFRDRLLDLRDRLLASPTFRRRAAAFRPTRPIARRRAGELFDLVAGFVYTQVLVACVRLDVFERLAGGAQPLGALASQLGLSTDAARRLLDAAVALRLVARRDRPDGEPHYRLGERGAPLVGDTAIRAMVLHHAALYADLADPVALLRATPAGREANALARFWDYDTAATGRPAAPVAAYSALMAASQPLVADEILDAYRFDRHRVLLDVGGGDGSFLARVGHRHAGLGLMLYDLPTVAAAARARLDTEGLAGRARVEGGSFLSDPLPTGADIATLVRVLHDHDDAPAARILRAVHAALPVGGRLLVAEPMAGTPGAEAMGDAYFGFYLLAMGRGRPRTAAELASMLAHAGFGAIRALPTRQPMQTGVLVATRLR